MQRLLDPRLAQALDRANPKVAHFVEVNAPDVSDVLRRAVDQFLVPVSQTPANSITADPAGALTIASVPSTLASFSHDDDDGVALPRTALGSNAFRALAWAIDPAFGSAVITQVQAFIRRKNANITNDLALQIYRLVSTSPPLKTFVPVLANPIVWKNIPAAWAVIGGPLTLALITFDLTDLKLALGRSNAPPFLTPNGEEQAYYFAIEPVNAGGDDWFYWVRDRTATRTIGGVGTFTDRRWFVQPNGVAGGWIEDNTLTPAVPQATIEILSHDTSAQAVYALDLGAAPQATSVGTVVFERGVPAGTAATLELSTAGSGGPWTGVADGDVVPVAQQTYHLRATMTATSDGRLAPTITAMGVQFAVPVDVTAEAIVEPITAEIGVPYCAAAIGEGTVTVVRTGRRDYLDPGSGLASANAASKLEVSVRLGSRHPAVPRDAWLLIDRAFVNDRTPSGTSEQFPLLSYLKTLKRKIPVRVESVNEIRVVAAATTSSVTVTADLPVVGDGYANRGFYMRVRSSSQADIGTGYLQTIDNTSGTRTLEFTANPLPGTLVADDVIEIHSAEYIQPTLSWSNADPADIWFEILTEHLAVPLERIGRAGYARGGYPPHVADRETDATVQQQLLVTLQLTDAENGSDLLDQLSFIMGGATVEIGGQIVFRQIYPLRDSTGQIVVPAEPVAFVFDQRTLVGLNTPVGLENRITQLACDYGVNTTAVSSTTPAALTTNFVDVDALAWLDDQSLDELAPAAIDNKIARWCYNSTDLGLYLASMLTLQVVRAASTGLRVWLWASIEAQPQLVVGDRVTIITDQYTDYDPSRGLPIRGWYAFTLVLVSVAGGGSQFHGLMLGLSDAAQLRGGPGTLAPSLLDEDAVSLIDFKEIANTDGDVTYGWQRGALVDEVWVAAITYPLPEPADPWALVRSGVKGIDPADADTYAVAKPAEGFVTYAQFEARLANLSLGSAKTSVIQIVLHPEPVQLASVETDDVEVGTLGTQFIQFTERGKKIVQVEAQTQIGSQPISAWGVPTRGPGAASTVRPPTLGALAYEHDITLDATRLSYITFRVTYDDGVQTIEGPFAFDRDKNPNFQSVTVTGTLLNVLADNDTKSIRVTRIA